MKLSESGPSPTAEGNAPGQEELRCAAFDGDRLIASGVLAEVARAVKETVDRGANGPVLVFNTLDSRPVEFDLRGTMDDVLGRLAVDDAGGAAPAPPRGRGRPRLGVVSREVTLLPRHWAWLAAQRGGASGALRRLVDQARRADDGGDRTRQAQDAAYRFCAAIAGNQPGFEESTRALFAGDAQRFEAETEGWPADIRDHARRLAAGAFPDRPVGRAEGDTE